ncbi:GntR family transcriptional regulator, partial [Salmonella enterica subsp. enterica serovar Kentucky]|nr:GntR family transcriptional regulator [Salmonella enterica subsp. enterica serovar Kentucky]
DIVHCLIPPGTPLSEKEVSTRFNVSRQPVREAFIKLAENGLIFQKAERKPNSCKDEQGRLRVGAAVGAGAGNEERVDALVAAGV